MLVALITLCLYCACFGFYHASAKRTAFEAIKTSNQNQKMVFWGSWALLAAALLMAASLQGWERGIPVWLALLNLTGGLSLLVTALAPKHHVLTGKIAALGFVLVLIIWMMGGGV